MASDPRLNSGNKTDLRIYRTGPLFDHSFGFDVLHKELFRPFVPALIRNRYLGPWRHQYYQANGISDIQDNRDTYKVNLDVQQFRHDEISVKMVGNHIVVEGKHKERQDEHGYISRQFQRRYKLPEGIVVDAVESKLSSDGVLSIEAPKKTIVSPSKDHVIQITHTNVPTVTSVPGAAMEEHCAQMTD
ncbi:hypothetical protein R5R35_004251 [Gryllus longicercus]|uniref:SHSP domain-containing protein n=1 Tax=Gryllus longicercus TaxID=2509291 RepID=A0AAN9W430_9ORTH